MSYYRLREDAVIEGAQRQAGFVVVMTEKKAALYAEVLEPVEAPEGDQTVAAVEAEPLIRTIPTPPQTNENEQE